VTIDPPPAGAGAIPATAHGADIAHTDPAVVYSQAWFGANHSVTGAHPGASINDGNHLEYSADAGYYGLAIHHSDVGNAGRVYAVMVFERAYRDGLMREDLAAIAQHENRHARIFIEANALGTMWQRAETAFGGLLFLPLEETHAYLEELSSNASWYHIDQRFYGADMFKARYDDAMALNAGAAGAQRTATREVLRDAYSRLPFIPEMYSSEYNWHVRAPE
jgi:hypothetical protein